MFCLPRTVKCGLCGVVSMENNYGDGFIGWIQIMGLIHETDPSKTNPMVCSECRLKLIECMNKLEK